MRRTYPPAQPRKRSNANAQPRVPPPLPSGDQPGLRNRKPSLWRQLVAWRTSRAIAENSWKATRVGLKVRMF